MPRTVWPQQRIGTSMTNERKAQKQRSVRSFVSHPSVPFRTKPGTSGFRTIPRRLVNRRRVIKALKRASHG